MKKNNPTIILVSPQLSENIGMTARVTDNFGLSKLFIVNPRDGWPSKLAFNTSKHGKNIINNAKIFKSLESAVSNYNLVVATSNRKRFLTKKTYDNFNVLKKKINHSKNVAIVFGPENSGLSNQDLRLADFLFTIPTAKTNKSLNLSHAVSVMSYEIFNSHLSKSSNAKNFKKDKVTKSELSKFMNFLINDLDTHEFFKPIEKKESMINNIYAIYNNINLSKKELRMLWGIHKKLKKLPKK